MQEIWRSVPGYEGLYEVSNWGRVRSVDRYVENKGGKYHIKERILNAYKCGNYLGIALSKNGVVTKHLIHRLVGMAFPDMVGWTEDAKGRPFEELQINHKDENPLNNKVDNLEWCDGFYNQTYSRGKTVYQYTIDGELVKIWSSTAECSRNGFRSPHIVNCCNNKKPQYKSFRWSYNPPSQFQ